MKQIYEEYYREIKDENGKIKNIEFIYNDSFNFAYDVMDRFASECPNDLAMVHKSTSGEITRFTFLDIKNLTDKAAVMLQSVIIENKDCTELICFHDGKGVFFYCDPPYYEAEDLYSSVPLFGEKKHKELHDTLLECEGKVLLSYNECEFIDKLYSEDKWYKLRLSRPHNMVLHSGGGQMYNEFLIANYNIFELYYFGSQMTLFDGPEQLTNGGRIIL